MEAHYTTDAVPTHQRLAYWRDAVSLVFPSADITMADEECRGALRLSQFGPVQVFTVRGEAMRIRLPARPVVSPRDAFLVVVTPTEGVAVVDQGDGVTRVGPGETAFCDLTRPIRMEFSRPYQAKCLVLPRWLLSLTEDELRRLTSAPVRPATRAGSLVSQLLTHLVNTAPSLPEGTGGTVVRNIVDLLCVLAGEQLQPAVDERPEAVRGLSRRVREYIDQHLGDPDLTPESIAQAHNISVRYLHKLFEHEATTVSRWIQRRRLHECRCELARGTASGRTISTVARRWGFTSAAHFSRAFRMMYHLSPAEWRRLASQKPGARTSPLTAVEYEAGLGAPSKGSDLRPAGPGTGIGAVAA